MERRIEATNKISVALNVEYIYVIEKEWTEHMNLIFFFYLLSYMRRYAVCIAIARLMANVFFINNYFLQRFSFLTTIVKCVCVCP